MTGHPTLYCATDTKSPSQPEALPSEIAAAPRGLQVVEVQGQVGKGVAETSLHHRVGVGAKRGLPQRRGAK